MSQLRSSLLGDTKKKLDTFEKLYDDCVYRIKKIKQKNDTLQKNAGTELEDEIAIEVQKQKEFIENEITELKEQMDEIQRKYRDPEAKNKMKAIKKEAQKEIERNKAVLREFINKSFLFVKARKSRGEGEEEDQGKYFEGGRQNMQDHNVAIGGNENGHSNGYSNGYNQDDNRRMNEEDSNGYNYQRNKQESQMESQLDIDYDLEHRLEDQKKQLLNQVQKGAHNMLEIMTDQAEIIQSADEALDLITDNVMTANKNVVQANQKMESAAEHQKKAKRKYICFAAIIVLVVILVVGIVLIIKLK